MTRHATNGNLTLYSQSAYKGLAVNATKGPLVEEYLEAALRVLVAALQEYGRVFAFRLDLRFPARQDLPYVDGNLVMERFVASLKAKIRHSRNKAREVNHNAHDSSVRYVWCREYGRHGVPHYHMAILLNYDAFCTLGAYELGRDNLFNRLHEAWASALGLSIESVVGLVELPENPFYLLRREDQEKLSEFFFRLSYLCKAATKYYGNGVHAFGTSRG